VVLAVLKGGDRILASQASSIRTVGTVRKMTYSLALLSIYLIATKDTIMSRIFLFGFVPIFYAISYLGQTWLPDLIRKLTFSGDREERILLIGPARRASLLGSWLEEKQVIGYRSVGILTDDPSFDGLPNCPVLGTPDELEKVVREHGITQVILTEFPMFSNVMTTMIGTCERLAIRITVVCDFEEKFHHSVVMFEDAGLRFLSIREEPLEDPFNRFAKRALDLAVSIPVILFILPFTTVLVWLCQQVQATGPVFYRQPRAGLQNRPFDIIKYRTMRLHSVPASVQATQDDPRIYPAGKWFRKLSIDELPQFINVLLGDMSVVGPRPHLLEHNDQFAKALHNYHVRTHVKPGITGLAQVRGYRGETRSQDDVVKRVRADILYLENWSFTLDCRIIFATIFHVVGPPKTAY
jgi:putative colanic acid biosynthesis UDP-glucose lipid carrier transferase